MGKRKAATDEAPVVKKAKAAPDWRVAFLRAVNVGGRVVKMATIAAHFRAMGFQDVSTFLASGNVLFDANGAPPSEDLEARIERYLTAHVGFEIPVMVRSKTQLEDLVAFVDANAPHGASTIHAMFGKTTFSDDQVALAMTWATASDSFAAATTDTLVWFAETTMSKSPCFNKPFEKLVGAALTLRNMNTVRRVLAKLI
ncbi:hypothetical protein SPRG_01718 [Saprolegnia parasitica CBS 223.65]|uniref:DUF1697 domain-containing protein n=1 Tax=Saprolegnia parasitica (strain CBS 223.65) TaxID=695850 RepID=A0A067CT16_SAPPC|nr:hypothetical protein SPRG_01718 [Saprolegnia parasitica CBS 223.65]KDO33839.1 hypothetical protein SPRG_01718 [Saprolegnia parasitica CBS 223.65]|eukprot:XP_012195475.1 hypothetical protein SPRG_01718 [Saprolegnia parasitica CBS 223.65]